MALATKAKILLKRTGNSVSAMIQIDSYISVNTKDIDLQLNKH